MRVSVRVCGVLLLASVCDASLAASVVRRASGATPAAIQAGVDQFRADLGGANNGVGGSFADGRREINWDGVPDNFAEPNALPANFFNVNSPRGVVFNTVNEFGTALNQFRVSADSSNPTTEPVRFGGLDASYPSNFVTFSAERLFQARGATTLDVMFFVPGTQIPATVSGFGVVFTDVDTNGRAVVNCYALDGTRLAAVTPNLQAQGLSFLGISFDNSAERCYRVEIRAGNQPLGAGAVDSGTVEVMALDDFIYGEPRSIY